MSGWVLTDAIPALATGLELGGPSISPRRAAAAGAAFLGSRAPTRFPGCQTSPALHRPAPRASALRANAVSILVAELLPWTGAVAGSAIGESRSATRALGSPGGSAASRAAGSLRAFRVIRPGWRTSCAAAFGTHFAGGSLGVGVLEAASANGAFGLVIRLRCGPAGGRLGASRRFGLFLGESRHR